MNQGRPAGPVRLGQGAQAAVHPQISVGETVVRFGARKRCFGGFLGCLVEAV
jgi:hypothetical protein